MNLINTFTRVIKLFARRDTKVVRFIDLNEHLRRDLGLDNTNSARRVRAPAARTEEYVIYGPLTRAP